MIRSRHILVGAALALALVTGSAGARQYKNAGAPTESIGVVPEVNDQAVSDANPLPVKVLSGGGGGSGSTGSVTAPGTSGTQAQAVQGINGGVPVGISAATLPLPAGAATEATQQGVATSNAAINAATGSQADAASASGANTTIIGALRAIRDRLLATLTVTGTVGISQTTPGTTNAVAVIGTDGTVQRQMQTTTTGALQPPTAASGKIVDTSVSLTANTSTVLVAARGTSGDRLAAEIQCDGTAVVGIDMKGGTLTSATAAPRVIPSGSYPLYTPPIATQTAITAYTGTAQTCRVTEYLR